MTQPNAQRSAGKRWLEDRTTRLLQQVWQALPIALRERVVRLIQPTFTVGVSAVLLNDRDQILFLRHRFRFSTSWYVPGGFLEKGEAPDEAIFREIREETGYSAQVLSLLRARLDRPTHLDICYLCRITGGSLAIDRREILDTRFVAFEDLARYIPEDEIQTIHLTLRTMQRDS